jgi:hypothetical protein
MQNMRKVIQELKEQKLINSFESLSDFDVVFENEVNFQFIISTERSIKPGNYPNTFLLSYRITQHEQSISFSFFDNLDTDATFSMKEMIITDHSSVNLAMEKILPNILSDNCLAYDEVYENGKKLYNKLKLTSKINDAIQEFTNLAQKASQTVALFEIAETEDQEKALLAYLENGASLDKNSYLKLSTIRHRGNQCDFSICVRNDKINHQWSIINMNVTCITTKTERIITSHILYNNNGLNTGVTSIAQMKCLSNATLFSIDFLEKLDKDDYINLFLDLKNDKR